MLRVFILILLLAVSAIVGQAQTEKPLLLQRPTVSLNRLPSSMRATCG